MDKKGKIGRVKGKVKVNVGECGVKMCIRGMFERMLVDG